MQASGQYEGAFLTVDLDTWAEEYRRHESVVRSYFEGRPQDLLAFRPADGDWAPLCEFLGRPIPDVPFPWENRYEAMTGR